MAVIDSFNLEKDKRYVALFRNEGDRKATAVDFACLNRAILHGAFGHRNENPERLATSGGLKVAMLSQLPHFLVVIFR